MRVLFLLLFLSAEWDNYSVRRFFVVVISFFESSWRHHQETAANTTHGQVKDLFSAELKAIFIREYVVYTYIYCVYIIPISSSRFNIGGMYVYTFLLLLCVVEEPLFFFCERQQQMSVLFLVWIRLHSTVSLFRVNIHVLLVYAYKMYQLNEPTQINSVNIIKSYIYVYIYICYLCIVYKM